MIVPFIIWKTKLENHTIEVFLFYKKVKKK